MKHRIVAIFFIIVCFRTAIKAQESLSLTQAVEIALKNNFSIQVAQNERLQQANNNVIGNAGMLPTIQANLMQDNTVTDTKQKFLNGANNDKNGAKAKQFNAGIELGWTLFDGLKMLATKSKLSENELVAKYKFKQQVEQVIGKVYKAYFDLVQAEQLLKIVENSLAISDSRRALCLSKYNIGKASKSEYLSSQVDYNTDKMQLLRQQVAVKNAQIALNQILSRDLTIILNTNFIYQKKAILNTDSLLYLVQTNNSTLAMLKSSKRALQFAYNETKSERYPSLQFKTGYNFSNTTSEAGFLQSSQNAGMHYGASLGFNLYNGGSLNRRLRNNQLQLKSAELNYKDSSLKIVQLLKQQMNQYEMALQLVAMETENTDVANSNFSIAQIQFDAGVYNALDFRQAQLNLLQAQTRLLNVKNELELAESELLKMVGAFSNL
jgi:outer membrane protein TolC